MNHHTAFTMNFWLNVWCGNNLVYCTSAKAFKSMKVENLLVVWWISRNRIFIDGGGNMVWFWFSCRVFILQKDYKTRCK